MNPAVMLLRTCWEVRPSIPPIRNLERGLFFWTGVMTGPKSPPLPNPVKLPVLKILRDGGLWTEMHRICQGKTGMGPPRPIQVGELGEWVRHLIFPGMTTLKSPDTKESPELPPERSLFGQRQKAVVIWFHGENGWTGKHGL